MSGMVGREQELALILDRWKLAKAEEGQLVLLSGEAGIGKSRVCRAVLDSIANETHIRINCQCSPYHTDSPLFPIIQNLTFSAGFIPGDGNDEKLAKLEAVLVCGEADRPLIAALIGLDYQTRYGVLAMTPQQQRARTLQALVVQLIARSRTKPVLLVLEDAHWVDATTLELVHLSLDQVAAGRVLILVTARHGADVR